MEKTLVDIISTQKIGNEKSITTYRAECLPLDYECNALSLTYFDENKTLVKMTLRFQGDNECLVKIIKPEYQTLIDLALNRKTKGLVVSHGLKMEIEFSLKKIFKKWLDISFEYDIFTNGKIVSTNSVKIEVKKC